MIPAAFIPLASHLWQSTLFAVALGLLTLALRPNRARVRYSLWLAASYKFLLPFSWLVRIGNHFQWRAAPAIVPSTFTAVAEVASPPIFLSEFPAVRPAPHPVPWLLYAIWALWAGGFVAVAASWIREWLRMRAIVRLASPLPLGLPIRAVSTPSRLEPGVFGLFRPVLLMPAGITDRLTPSQMQTIIEHELCHVRRRDNLAAAIHMLVESIFWFHPLVWWLGARLVKERERACDEAVIAAGGDREAYAEALLTVCMFYVKLPLASAAGVAGADLRKRIGRIMTLRVAQKLNGAKKALLTATAAATVFVPIFIGSTIAPASRAAAQADSPTSAAFQVVHIQVAQPGAIGTHIYVGRESLQLQNYPLRRVIGYAYGAETVLVTGPDSLLDAKYNLEAKAPGPLGNGYPAVDTARAMLRNLLAEKFQIEFHRGTQSISAYVLTSAGANALLKVAQPGEPGPRMQQGETSITGLALRMGDFVELLSRRVDHPVIDQTALTQTYDFNLDWEADVSPAQEPADKIPGPLTNPKPVVIAEALQSQLGLRLQLQQIPAELLIVDRVELPSDIAAAYQAVAMDPALFDGYAGHYALPGNLIMTVFRDGGHFQAQLPGQPPLEIFPEGQGKFFANAVDVQIDFGDGSLGQSSGLVLHQNGRDLKGPRMDDAAAERLLEAQKTKFQQQVSTMGTEQALHKMILGLAVGKPNYSEMNPLLAEAVTEQLPEMQRRFAKLGSLVSTKFTGVDPMGRDIYDAQFEHGSNEWHLSLSADGKIDTAFVGPDR